jgi:hypothetical protein
MGFQGPLANDTPGDDVGMADGAGAGPTSRCHPAGIVLLAREDDGALPRHRGGLVRPRAPRADERRPADDVPAEHEPALPAVARHAHERDEPVPRPHAPVVVVRVPRERVRVVRLRTR